MTGFEIQPWSAFRDQTPADVAYLVDGLVPCASVGFTGAGKGGGKTWADLALAVAVATARPWLGRFTVPEARPVVYFALEGAQANIRARLGALARGMGVDPDGGDLDDLHIVYKPRLIDLRDADLTAAMVVDVLERVQSPGLSIFDVLRRAARVRESGEGVADFLEVLEALRPLLDAGCAVNFAHHFHKATEQGDKRDPGERMSGSGSLYGHADYGVWITKTDRHARRMDVEFTTRDGAELPPAIVRLEGDGSGRFGGFTYTDTARLVALRDEDAEEQRIEALDRLILGYIASRPGAGVRDLRTGVDARSSDIDDRRKALIAADRIVVDKGGGKHEHYLPDDLLRERVPNLGTRPDTSDTAHHRPGVSACPSPEGGHGTDTDTVGRVPGSGHGRPFGSDPLDATLDPDEWPRAQEDGGW